MAQKSNIHIARWLEEDREEDFIDGPAGSDDDLDHVEEELESSTSEYSEYHETEDTADANDVDWETVFNVIEGPNYHNYHLGLEGTKWMKEPIEARLILQSEYNAVLQSGPRDFAKTRNTPLECFNLFFDESILYTIAKCTNDRIEKEKKKFSRERDAKLTDEVEICALLGILLLSGSTKSSKENFLQLFDTKKGIGMEAIYLAMSSQRYRFLMKNLRFNDPTTEKNNEDKMAAIRVLFQMVVNNFQKHFTPSHELGLGQVLTAYKGRCGFRQYMPKKTIRYGIKMFALVDCQYPYTYNLELYLGDNPGPYEVSNSKLDIMVRMTDPIQGEYRNVTTKNCFTTLEAAELLFDKKITMVGSIKPKKKEVPRVFKTTKDKTLYASLFGFSHVATLVQYIVKPGKATLLLSTKHSDCSIDTNTGNQQKPEVVTYYNRTKNSVALMDKMCSTNDVTRNSRRWALTILFRLINIAALNALCIYTLNKEQERIVRREFQTEMALSMIKPMIQRRMYSEVIPKVMKQKMYEILNLPVPADLELQQELSDTSSCVPRSGPRGRCHVCRRVRINKTTREICATCTKFTCIEHSKYLCNNCYSKYK